MKSRQGKQAAGREAVLDLLLFRREVAPGDNSSSGRLAGLIRSMARYSQRSIGYHLDSKIKLVEGHEIARKGLWSQRVFGHFASPLLL